MRIGNKEFDFGQHTYVMGILNVTPDSFSDGGKYTKADAALRHAEEMIKDGADIIDIGGESTRPGYLKISKEDEIKRIISVIQNVKREFAVPVSVDTYKSAVAQAALEAGADMINDIWGFRYEALGLDRMEEGENTEKFSDKNHYKKSLTMAEVAAKYQVPVCLMHNRPDTNYENFMQEVLQDLEASIEIGIKAGVKRENIILDPGVGFGKTYEMNLEIMQKLERLFIFNLPVLLGASRKSVLGLALGLPVEEREEATIATTVMAVMKGCHFVRVHNVKGNIRAIKMTEKILSV